MTKQLVVGVVMDPIADITYKKDTTLALLLAAKKRGWKLKYMEMGDLHLRQGKAFARMADLDVFANPEKWFELGEAAVASMAELDILLMRTDPPFDGNFLTSTWLLEAAEREGVLVVNKPQSLRDCNEKLFAQEFPECCPPTLVSSNSQLIREFHAEHQDIILKPLDGMGGMGIFRVKEEALNLGAIIEELTDNHQRQIMVQRFVPEIKDGDTRILVINGEPVPYGLARIPMAGETRGNLAAGGSGVARKLTERDYWIVKQVAPVLKAKGLMFVGLDVIGDYLTEINVTSPTCVRELDEQCGLDIGGQLMAYLAERLGRGWLSAWFTKLLKWQRPIIWTLLIALLLHFLLLLTASSSPEEEDIQQMFFQATEVLLYDLEEPILEEPLPVAPIPAEPLPPEPPIKEQPIAAEAVVEESVVEEAIPEKPVPTEPAKPRFSKSLISRSLEIARLEAELAAMQNSSAQQPRVRRISSGARMSSEEALYLRQWEEKVERIGNLNYPEAARKKNLGGRLRLLVVIAADGRILEAQLLTGSGHTLLDDAAIRILNLAAPFAPLPDSIKAQADVLEIIRTWQFGDGWYANWPITMQAKPFINHRI